ncbi:MAG: hypothetical protein O3A51_10140 [Verrucomicrobia bacterium]|nr:hypothetical protein [Verrucomicrobiota bacterium]
MNNVFTRYSQPVSGRCYVVAASDLLIRIVIIAAGGHEKLAAEQFWKLDYMAEND